MTPSAVDVSEQTAVFIIIIHTDNGMRNSLKFREKTKQVVNLRQINSHNNYLIDI
jgi:hypothetical protein